MSIHIAHLQTRSDTQRVITKCYKHCFFVGANLVDNPDVNQLSDMFFEAAETERALPPAIRKQKLCSWPEYRQQWSSY